MAKRRRVTDRSAIEKRLREGRGEGRGYEYAPYLRIQDVPSLGLASRIKGLKTGRVHHLQSKLELQYFYLLEWEEDVLDIREGYPLTPLADVMAIAEENGIRYPVDPQTRHPIIMTEDFLVTLRRGLASVELARAIKYEADLKSPRTREKLFVQQKYWEARGIDWRVVTEKLISKVKAENIGWLHPFTDISALHPLREEDIQLAYSYMTDQLLNSVKPLAAVAESCDRYFNWEYGFGLAVARYLLANRHWTIDMNEPLHPRRPLRISSVTGGLRHGLCS